MAEERVKSEKEDVKGDYITGIIGALLGAIISSIPWVLLYSFAKINLGMIAALIPIGTFWGYKIFGGKITKAMMVIISIISVFIFVIGSTGVLPMLIQIKDGIDINMTNFYQSRSTDRFLTHFAFALVIEVLTLIALMIIIKEQIDSKQEKIGIFKKRKINDEITEIENKYREVFKNLGATSKETAINKNDIIKNVDGKKQYVEKELKVLELAGFVKKSKGKFYYSISVNKTFKNFFVEFGSKITILILIIALGILFYMKYPIIRKIKDVVRKDDTKYTLYYEMPLEWVLVDNISRDSKKQSIEKEAEGEETEEARGTVEADENEKFFFLPSNYYYSLRASGKLTEDTNINGYYYQRLMNGSIDVTYELDSGFETYQDLKEQMQSYVDNQLKTIGIVVETGEIKTAKDYSAFFIKTKVDVDEELYNAEERYYYYIFDKGKVAYVTIIIIDTSYKDIILEDAKHVMDSLVFTEKKLL